MTEGRDPLPLVVCVYPGLEIEDRDAHVCSTVVSCARMLLANDPSLGLLLGNSSAD
jgi:hypothetical protein